MYMYDVYDMKKNPLWYKFSLNYKFICLMKSMNEESLSLVVFFFCFQVSINPFFCLPKLFPMSDADKLDVLCDDMTDDESSLSSSLHFII